MMMLDGSRLAMSMSIACVVVHDRASTELI